MNRTSKYALCVFNVLYESYFSILWDMIFHLMRNHDSESLGKKSFDGLVEGIEDVALFLLDPQGCVSSWNQGAERIQGYRAEEILGHHFSCFFTPDEIAKGTPLEHLKRVADEGRVVDEAW